MFAGLRLFKRKKSYCEIILGADVLLQAGYSLK